ncbi:MAG TPA: outer membrane beta-barrel protein [Xanthobacteraceae bacterium]|nr:outer membrane beta-barrel protein [Xanthobacteraceae bacterium]
MKRFLLLGVVLLAVTASNRSMAAGPQAWVDGLPGAWITGGYCDPYVDYNCAAPKVSPRAAKNQPCDPYVNYSCLDAYLGDDFFTRLYRYYELEWGKAVPPADPKAPPSRRSDAVWPPTPQSTPPMPFTEWPYGGTINIGVTTPNSVDSPLMVALSNTQLGHAMSDAHIQVYGWVEPGANISTNTVRPAGNLPVSYDYTPNTIQLDQAVLYIERLPDETQNDHFDWGFRISGLYGVDGRYTTAYGLFSNQLLKENAVNIYDMPMVYLDLYYPVMQGLNVRIGRFISIPDIEAQLAPNNYTFVHSLTYTWDNYTNTGIEFTLAVTKNWILQLGTTIGTEAMPWHWGAHVANQYVLTNQCGAGFGCGVDPLYPGTSMLRDPGAVPSITAGLRWTSDDGRDDFNFVMDAWNSGVWGYNNLQWIGFTYYHKWNEYWHFAFETWNIHERNVPDLNNAGANYLDTNFGTPFSPNILPFNAPNAAWCLGPSQMGNMVAGAPLTCTADEQTFLLYVNYSPNKLNNFSLRTEYFNDPQGQRTGVATAYADVALSWQHWFSPQVEIRPEIGYYRSLNQPAFNGNAAAGISPTRDWALIAATDLIWHF